MGGVLAKKKGNGNDREKNKASNRIDNAALNEHLEDQKLIKLLLLGTGESGKSTLFKQMVKLYGEGFDKKSMKSYTPAIYKNIIVGMKTLVKNSGGIEGGDIGPGFDDEIKYLQGIKDEELDAKSCAVIKKLWTNKGIKTTFKNRGTMQIPDSAEYFFDNVERIAQPGYVPIYEDVLRCRARTTGIVNTNFKIQGNRFQMMDVGGQRSERKKWIHCFENVTAIIFVAAINEYDQVLYEDGKTNRVLEALELFGKTCNNNWFENAAVILFLNKQDLFHKKLETVDLTVCFPDYAGKTSQDAEEFMQAKFLAQNQNPNDVDVYPHVTCATDTNNIKHTFNSVKDILLTNSIKGSGLM